jgi:hypothetical protein
VHNAANPAEFKNWAPISWEGVPIESPTAIERVHHVGDVEIDGDHVRLQRTLNEHNLTLASTNTEALVKQPSYRTSNAAEVPAVFRKASAWAAALPSSLATEQSNHTAAFEGEESIVPT